MVEEAYALNYPLLAHSVPAQPNGTLPPRFGFAEGDADDVLIETIKKAEDDEAWIVRVYEYKQYRRSEVNISFGQPLRRAVECNLLEEESGTAVYSGERLSFSITPYEVKTFKIWF